MIKKCTKQRNNLFVILPLALILLCIITACSKEEVERVPEVPVNVLINLNDQRYVNLKLSGGWVYVDGGVKGILVRRDESGSFWAFERNSTYNPSAGCAVAMDGSWLYLVDSCSSSQFDFKGQPFAGPARYALKQYHTTVEGTFLRILN